jgi:hypothetical protein
MATMVTKLAEQEAACLLEGDKQINALGILRLEHGI